jgi:hypothetical protein
LDFGDIYVPLYKEFLIFILHFKTVCRSAGVRGRITVNGQPMVRSQFRKLCCYIAQDFAMLGLLTVQETLQIAANFKLPGNISSSKRKALVCYSLNNWKNFFFIEHSCTVRALYLWLLPKQLVSRCGWERGYFPENIFLSPIVFPHCVYQYHMLIMFIKRLVAKWL